MFGIDPNNMALYIDLAIAFLTLAGVIVAVIGIFRGVHTYKNQMNAQLFLEFTKRFEEVMESFPEDAWPSRLNINAEPPPESKELSASVLRYLNLCGEEYYLYLKEWLDEKVWKIWEDELIRTLQTPLFRREWPKLSSEFEAYLEFKEYVNDKQKGTRRN